MTNDGKDRGKLSTHTLTIKLVYIYMYIYTSFYSSLCEYCFDDFVLIEVEQAIRRINQRQCQRANTLLYTSLSIFLFFLLFKKKGNLILFSMKSTS